MAYCPRRVLECAVQGLPGSIFRSPGCDDVLQPLYETSTPLGIVDTVSEKWRSIDVNPPLYHPGDIWVIIDTNSIKSDGVFIGTDASVSESHSKKGPMGGPLIDLEAVYDWMIRLELVKLAPEEVRKLEGGVSAGD